MRPIAFLTAEGQQPLADSVIMVTELLKKVGYVTAAFGKWGLGPVGSSGDPTKQGFDRFYGYNCQALAHHAYPNHLWENEQKIILTTNRNLQQTNEYAPDLIQQQALAFLKEPNKKQPFLLFLPCTLSHAELVVPDDSISARYKGKFTKIIFKGADYGPNAKTNGYT